MKHVQFRPGVILTRESLLPRAERLFARAGLREEKTFSSRLQHQQYNKRPPIRKVHSAMLGGHFPCHSLLFQEEGFSVRDGMVYTTKVTFSKGCSPALKMLTRTYREKDHGFEFVPAQEDGVYTAVLAIPEPLELLVDRSKEMCRTVGIIDNNHDMRTGYEAGEEIIRIKIEMRELAAGNGVVPLTGEVEQELTDRLRYFESIYLAASKFIAMSRTIKEMMGFVVRKDGEGDGLPKEENG